MFLVRNGSICVADILTLRYSLMPTHTSVCFTASSEHTYAEIGSGYCEDWEYLPDPEGAYPDFLPPANSLSFPGDRVKECMMRCLDAKGDKGPGRDNTIADKAFYVDPEEKCACSYGQCASLLETGWGRSYRIIEVPATTPTTTPTTTPESDSGRSTITTSAAPITGSKHHHLSHPQTLTHLSHPQPFILAILTYNPLILQVSSPSPPTHNPPLPRLLTTIKCRILTSLTTTCRYTEL